MMVNPFRLMVLENQDNIICLYSLEPASYNLPLSAASDDVALPKYYSFEAFEKRLDYLEKTGFIQF